jgi:translation initiation factor IF-3
VRVIDKKGSVLGDMDREEGIRIAKSQGLNLILKDMHSEPPVCQITDDIINDPDSELIPEKQGYSFDPTLRVATIRFSSTIDDLELDRKVDILRKHLLENRRCEVIVYNKEIPVEAEEIRDLFLRIQRDVNELCKSPDGSQVQQIGGEYSLRLWPCRPDQTDQVMNLILPEDEAPEALPPKGHPRKFRKIRPRTDPHLLISGEKPDANSD